ncbi:MAG: hypothetical protein ACLR4Z_12720 [Butyricicoccaceae bacterium]
MSTPPPRPTAAPSMARMPCVRAAGEEKAVVRAEITRRRDLCVADRAVAEVEIARAVGLGVVDGKNIAND